MVQKQSRVLRELLAKNKPLIVPGAPHALAAKIFQAAGFEAVYMSGYFTSATHFGLPDASFIGLGEMCESARRIAGSVSIPLICDGDTGYGNAVNVVHTVKEFIKTGAAAIHLEDQILPKRCGHVAGRQLISMEEAVGKIRAAADTRDEYDPDFLLIARTDARGAHNGSIEEAVKRGNAYKQAGADIVFVEGPTCKEEVALFCKEIDGPILYNFAGNSPRFSAEELEELGVAIAILPGGGSRVMNRALHEFATQLKVQGPAYEGEWLDKYGKDPMVNIHDFIGFPLVRQLEDRYLSQEETKKYEDSIGFQP